MPALHRVIAVLTLGVAPVAMPPATFAPGAGVQTVQARCTACHAPSMITTRHFTAQRWADVVDQMIAKGAQVSDAEYPAIVAYLTRTYGPDKQGQAGA